MKLVMPVALACFLCTACSTRTTGQAVQKVLPRINAMADVPQPLKIIDYYQLAHQFDKTVYDFNATGKYWPLVWIDSSGKNFNQPVIGLYTAIGDVRQGPANAKGMFHEALASMGAVLGATLVGINKHNQQGINYVAMLKNYFNRETGWNIMMNNTCPEVSLLGGGYGRDWWYDVYPNVLFYAIYSQYPQEPGFDSIAHHIAEKFCQADSILNGNYHYSFFDYGQMKPMTSQLCIQPDAAAGHAYVLYAAYKRFKDPRYLKAAAHALQALESEKSNPSYEVLMPLGAYLAARINAEQDTKFNLAQLLHWSIDGTAVCREGWGMLVGNWNGYDISGIVGSTVDHGGYGFLMNTYDAALPLLPLVRYDQSYSKAIAKWMLNAANAARFFYPQYLPAAHQTIPQLAAVTKNVIGYEGIIKQSAYAQHASLPGPVAQGDGPLWVPGKNPPESQFSVYGSAHAGIFGSIIRKTAVEGILQLNLLATDFFHDAAYPSYLYYNPYNTSKQVTISVSAKKATDFYNTVKGRFITKHATSSFLLQLAPQEAAVIVCIPSGGKISYQGKKMLVNGIVADYNKQRN